VKEEPVWERVADLRVDTLRDFLGKEHPQTVAFLLSRIDSSLAASVVTTFSAEARNGLLGRMVAIKAVADDAVRALESVIREELLVTESQSSHVGIADMLNRLDKKQSDEMLKTLAEVRPEEAKAIKSLLFSFEDVAKLPSQARTTLLDQVPVDRLVLALKGTEPDFQATILSALASRSRRMVEAELQGGGTPSPRDVAEARRTIVAAVLKMIANGEVQLAVEEQPDTASAA
jgi:flagellar motor switch protein FliG